MEDRQTQKRRAAQIVRGLARLYPGGECALVHVDPLQLLIATILSAQCTDARVNLVTPALFARYPDAASFANADPAELESLIRSTGFFRAKTRSIVACCKQVVECHGGAVPSTMDELVQLSGIGRKTANVILGVGFGVPGIAVDTHVTRLSRRMGLTVHDDPVKIEHDLMALVPRKEWTLFGLRMILHGRQVCSARKPNCDGCGVAPHCPKIGVTTPFSRDAKGSAGRGVTPRASLRVAAKKRKHGAKS
jgi:endonuclease-3